MRINSFNPNLINYKPMGKSIAENKVCNAKPTPYIPYKQIPSVAFMGIPIKNAIERIKLPWGLERLQGEIYSICIFNKNENKKITAFLNYDCELNKLAIFDQSAYKIGNLNLVPDKWCKKTIYNNPLPFAYTSAESIFAKNKSYANIGTNLMQAAVEKSLEFGAEGRLYVFAWNKNGDNDPFVFYNKMGLSLINPYNNPPKLSRYIERVKFQNQLSNFNFMKLIKNLKGKLFDDLAPDEQMFSLYEVMAHQRKITNKPNELNEISLNFSEFMYLHNDNVQEIWLPKIKEAPIFSPNNRIK